MKRLLFALLICAGLSTSLNMQAQRYVPEEHINSIGGTLACAIHVELISRNGVTQEEINSTLSEWQKNNPELFHPFKFFTVQKECFFCSEGRPGRYSCKGHMIRDYLAPHIVVTVNDIIRAKLDAFKTEMSADSIARSNQVIQCLESLGVEQKLSQKQYKIFVEGLRLAKYPFDRLGFYKKDPIELLQQFAKASNIELPEDLKN